MGPDGAASRRRHPAARDRESAGVTLGQKTGWFGTVRWRYLGPTPLTEDNAFRAPPISRGIAISRHRMRRCVVDG